MFNNLGKQIQTSLRLISVSLSNVLYCIYDVSVVSRCTLYLNKILFTLNERVLLVRQNVNSDLIFYRGPVRNSEEVTKEPNMIASEWHNCTDFGFHY